MKINKDELRVLVTNVFDEAYTAGRHNDFVHVAGMNPIVEQAVQEIERVGIVAAQEERDRRVLEVSPFEQKARALVSVIDALCRAHGVALSHEDGHGRFEIVECEERSQGFDGAISLVWADGTRKYL